MAETGTSDFRSGLSPDLGPDLGEALSDIERFGREMRAVRDTARDFSKTLAGGVRLAVAGGRDLDAIFRRLALSLSQRVLTRSLNGLEGALTRSFSGLLGQVTGLGGGQGAAHPILPFAAGGVVSRPSYFPLPSGGVGLMGEAGAEAILPLARGSDGRLGVRSGQGAAGVSITFNVTTPDVEGFRRSEVQLSKMVARAAGRGRRGL